MNKAIFLFVLFFCFIPNASAKKVLKEVTTYIEVEVPDEDAFRKQLSISFSAFQASLNITNPKGIQPNLPDNKAYAISIGTNAYGYRISMELIGIKKLSTNYNYTVPFGSKTDERSLEMTGFGLNAQNRWFKWGLIDFFTGINLQYIKVLDNVNNNSLLNSGELDGIFYFTPTLGIQLFPRSALSFTLEARYLLPLNEISRDEIISVNSIGTSDIQSRKLDMSGLLIGGGIQWNF